MTTEAPDSAAVSDDEFSNAFEDATAEAPAPAAEAPAPAAEAPAPAAEAPAPAAEAPAPAAEAPAPAAEAPAPAAEETPEQLRARIAELDAALAAARTPVPAPVAQQPKPQAAPDPAPAPEQVPVYTKEEEGAIAKYREDWPDIAAAEALVRRKEYREIVAYVFEQVQASIAPVMEYYQTRSGRDQYADILSVVPDYDAVRDKAVAWAQADTQPAYMKDAFAKVIAEGTPADVADLIARYKKDVGYSAPAAPVPAPATAMPAAAVKPVAALSPAAQKAAGTLTVVKTSRSVQTEGSDPNDFDAAFAEATRAAR